MAGVRRLESRVAVVTGGGHGIGAATAKRLARDGATVGVCDIRAQGADETVAQIIAEGGRAQAFVADVADRDAVAGLVSEIERALGPIQILENNAGRLVPGTALTQEIDEWERTLSVNVRVGVPDVPRRPSRHARAQERCDRQHGICLGTGRASRTWLRTTPPRPRSSTSPGSWLPTTPARGSGSTASAQAGSAPGSTIHSFLAGVTRRFRSWLNGRCLWDVRAQLRRSRMRWRSSAATTPATSPATPSSSTAA